MTNNLVTMRERLRQQLSDVDDATWDAGEKDDLLNWALRRLNYKVPRALDPSSYTITLVADTYWYAVPAALTSLERVVIVDADGDEVGRTVSWELVGDILGGTAKIHVAPAIVEGYVGGELWLYGAGRYDLDTNYIPDELVPAVLANARAEALGRLVSNRMQFKQWQVANQVQNISVNELLQMVNQAERAAAEETALLKRWQMPVTGRLPR